MIGKYTFNSKLKELFPDRTFTSNQYDFFKYALNTINQDKDCSKITVFPQRCGFGKSTFLKALIESWIEDEHTRGLIIVTDKLSRLEEFYGNKSKIAFLTAENKKTEIIRQVYCPVLLMSTQRYFQCDDMSMFLKYHSGKNTYPRDTIIFDERPYFYQINEIGIKELNQLHTAFHDGIPDVNDDKAWIISQYENYRSKMIREIENMELKRNKTTYMYWLNQDIRLSDDESRFVEIFYKYLPEITSVFPEAKTTIKAMVEMISNGAIFYSRKITDNDDYEKGLLAITSNINKLILNNTKVFVFDASANNDILYPCDGNSESWVTYADDIDIDVPLEYMRIHLIDVNTSRNAILNGTEKENKLEAIKNYIFRKKIPSDDALLISYKPLIEKEEFLSIGFDRNNSLYFGDVKGTNQFKDIHSVIQIGLNRKSDINYLIDCLIAFPDFQEDMKELINSTIEKNIAWFDNMMDLKNRLDIVRSVMIANVMDDFMQNVYRSKARDITNEERVDVYLFCAESEEMLLNLQYIFGRLGAKITVEPIKELEIQKIKNRNTETMSNPQKLLYWIEEQQKGKVFTLDELFYQTGLTQTSFNDCKRHNRTVSNIFKDMKIGKGKYQIR